MKKKLISIAMLAALVLTLAACGITTTTTTTESHTDANGNTVTTTTTTTTENGKTETSTTVEETDAGSTQIVADMTFQNETGFDIVELYLTNANDENWGVNILEATEYGPLNDGEYVTYDQAFTYTMDDVLWDLMIVDENGDYVEFDEIDVSAAADPEDITLAMAYDSEDDSYFLAVE